MNDARLERLLDDVLADIAAEHVPDRLGRDITLTSGRVRQRPRWLAIIKEPPMRLSSRVAVGSPTLRLAYVVILTTLLALLALGTVVAGASLLPTPAIVVAQDGSGTVRTITEAVAMAEDGDTVVIRPGRYVESVDVAKDITLTGEGDRADIVIEATLAPYPGEPEFILNWAFVFRDSAATLRNVTIIGQQEGDAIWVGDGAAPVLEDITIDLLGTYTGDHVPIWWTGEGGILRDSTVAGYMGVASGSPLLERNTITGCVIVVEEADAPVIRGNTIRDCPYGYLISVEAGMPTIEANDLGDLSGTGIQVMNQPESVIVSGNTIHDLGTGISIGTSTPTVTIEGNTITGNVTGVLVSRPDTAVVMADNTYCGNRTDLIVPDGSTLTLDGNTICADAASSSP